MFGTLDVIYCLVKELFLKRKRNGRDLDVVYSLCCPYLTSQMWKKKSRLTESLKNIYYGLFSVRGGSMFVDSVNHSYPQIYIPTNLFKKKNWLKCVLNKLATHEFVFTRISNILVTQEHCFKMIPQYIKTILDENKWIQFQKVIKKILLANSGTTKRNIKIPKHEYIPMLIRWVR